MTTLADLAQGFGLAVAQAWAERAVTGVAIDHRRVAPGNVFGAFQGARVDGEDYIPDAIAAGAIAVVARPQAQVTGAAHLADPMPRRAFAALAARFFGRFPAHCVAVTGTNGKTSTAELTRQLWHMAGHKAASIGTLGVTTAHDRVTTGMTTPDIVTFLGTMSGLAAEGVTHAAFEASSHGLDQFRTEGLPVAAGAFTNLTRDHLDYHGTMEAYLAAKLRLARAVIADDGAMVLWADDPASAHFADAAAARGLRLIRVGQQGAEVRLVARTATPLGQRLTVAADGQMFAVDLPLIGDYQAANALVAAGLVIACGGDVAAALADLARVQGVPGRLERAAITAAGVPIYVDYAHTPDAVAAVLAALHGHRAALGAGQGGRIIIVLGAGGDRDTGKRAAMGAAAAAGADLVIVTDDNPRGENPAAIRAAVRAGAPDALDIADRRDAIAAALAAARAGDMICIAGKGHEQGQTYGAGPDARTLPFDDRVVARECAA